MANAIFQVLIARPGMASVTLTIASYSRTAATASLRFGADGNVYATNGGAESLQYAWLLSGLASSVDVRATLISGTYSTGTTGSWLNLASDRTWTLNWPGGLSPVTVQSTFELRDTASGTVLASATITLITTP